MSEPKLYEAVWLQPVRSVTVRHKSRRGTELLMVDDALGW